MLCCSGNNNNNTTTSATDARVSSVLANEISLNRQRSALVTAVAGMFYGMLRLLTVLFGWTNAAASPQSCSQDTQSQLFSGLVPP